MAKYLGDAVRLIRTFLRVNPQVVIIGLIAAVSFVLFYVFFQQASQIEYFKEIIAALIATLLTVTITTMLLKAQTKGEEIKERNVEVFRKKVEIYDSFIGSAIDSLADNELSEEEAKDIRKKIYHLSLFSSPETVETVVDFVRSHILKDTDEVSLQEVIDAFRSELSLENSEYPVGMNLGAIENLLRIGYSRRQDFSQINQFFSKFCEELEGRITIVEGEKWAFYPASGAHEGLVFIAESPQKVDYQVVLGYPTEQDFSSLEIELCVDLESARPALRPRVAAAAAARAFTWSDEEQPDNYEDNLQIKRHTLKCRSRADGQLVVSGAAVLKKIADDINAIEKVSR